MANSQQKNFEVKWITSKNHPKPNTMQQPSEEALAKYKNILLDHNDDQWFPEYSFDIVDFVSLSCKNWLSSAAVQFVTKLINDGQTDSRCIYLNECNVDEEEKQISDCSKIIFLINIACHEKQYFVTGHPAYAKHIRAFRGSHWTLGVYYVQKNVFFYCDTLGRNAPFNILKLIEPFTKKEVTMVLCHDPAYHAKFRVCDSNKCLNYALQRCPSVCGVSMLINAAVCAFDEITFSQFLDPCKKDKLFLCDPTEYSDYFRKILIDWIMNKNVNMELLTLKHPETVFSKPFPVSFSDNKSALGSTVRNGTKSTNQASTLTDYNEISLLANNVNDLAGECTKINSSTPHLQEMSVSCEKPEFISGFPETSQSFFKKTYVCDECSVCFSYIRNLRRHERKQHAKKRSGGLTGVPSFDCNECPKSFLHHSSLCRHVKQTHALRKKRGSFDCNECPKSFFHHSNLCRHAKQAHAPRNQENTRKFMCIDCGQHLKSHKDYVHHCNSVHNKNFSITRKRFDSETDFFDWKSEVEMCDNAMFVKHRQSVCHDDCQVSFFYCHRSGHAKRISNEDRYRALKMQGTCKLESTCPAFIKSITVASSGIVDVDMCLHHFGHECEPKHLRISDECRKKIAARLNSGVAISHILDEIRDDISGTNPRDAIITRQEIRNIMALYRIDNKKRHANDATSVEVWVEELKLCDHNPIICYKRQGWKDEEQVLPTGIQKNDFLLGIQTKTQLDTMKKLAHRVVCVDTTYGVTQYDFKLVTVLVLDEFDEGIPVGWLISNKEDTFVLSYFFKQLQERVGDIQTEVFMSDDADALYNSWRQAFGNAGKKLLCCWHVDRSWRQALARYVGDRDTQILLYHALKVLQYETNESNFRRKLQSFLQLCDENCSRFAAYFNVNYIPRIREWSSSFRVDTPVNCNMAIESFHRVLKGVYFNKRANKRVDELLRKLFLFSRDKDIDRWSKLQGKGKSTAKLVAIHQRHRTARSIELSCVSQISNCEWKVASQKDKKRSYSVKQVATDCKCQLTCSFCSACRHKFKCECKLI